MPIDLSRRSFLRGIGAALAAPAVVKAASLMPISAPKLIPQLGLWVEEEPRMVWYSNRVIRCYLDVEAIRDRNVLLDPADYASAPLFGPLALPVRVTDPLPAEPEPLWLARFDGVHFHALDKPA